MPDKETPEQVRPLLPDQRSALGKRIASLRHRIANPAKHGREAWTEEELTRMGFRLDEMATARDQGREAPKRRFVPEAPRPKPRKESDLLGERRTNLRRLSGDVAVPDIKALVKHAERYGTDEVVRTATELGYGFESCVQLMDACDRAEAAAHAREHPHAPVLTFGPSEDRVQRLLGDGGDKPAEAQADSEEEA